jgi:hypothetical protein
MIKKPTPADVQAERNQAMQDYVNEQEAARILTAKLRAERLARDAEERANPKPKEPVKAKGAKGAKGAAKVKAPEVRMAKSRMK